ncbi:MAG: MATE family efflux transporter [Hyphomicrobiaceae bacterium]
MTRQASDTAGPPSSRLTHRDVLAIALPIILSNVTTPLVGAIDTAVVGQLGDAAIMGGVAIGATIFSLAFWSFGFLRMGTSGLTAQADGAGASEEAVATLERAVLIGLGAGAGLILLQVPILWLATVLIEGSAEVEAAAASYFHVRIWSAPAVLVNYAISGWLIGLGRARSAFLLQLAINLVNIALSIFLVLGLGRGIAGVAEGSVAAEIAGLALGLAIVAREAGRRGGRVALARVAERTAIRRMMAVNADIMIRNVCLIGAFTYFTALSARNGDVLLAANALLMDLFGIAAYFLDGFANAAEVHVGRAFGARRTDRLREALVLPAFWAGGLSVAAALVLWLAGPAVIDLMTTSAEVRAAARDYLLWTAATPLAGFACFQLDGIFIGATRSADMRNMMILSLGAYLGAIALLAPAFGNHGLWAALIVFFLARGLTLGSRIPALVDQLARESEPARPQSRGA